MLFTKLKMKHPSDSFVLHRISILSNAQRNNKMILLTVIEKSVKPFLASPKVSPFTTQGKARQPQTQVQKGALEQQTSRGTSIPILPS